MQNQCEWNRMKWIRLPAEGLDTIHGLAQNCGLPPLGDTNSPSNTSKCDTSTTQTIFLYMIEDTKRKEALSAF